MRTQACVIYWFVIILVLFVCLRNASPSHAQACIEGDANGDGKVTLTDYEVWRRIYKGGAATSPTPGAQSPSGEAMPIGNLPHFTQIFTEDFNQNAPIGTFPGPNYQNKWYYYDDGTPDTAGQQGKPSVYFTSKVVSVTNGILNKHLHFENGKFMASALLPLIKGNTGDQLYGKYTIRYRVLNPSLGYKQAWLLWPQSEKWPDDGEIDFPETDFTWPISGYHHYAQPYGIEPHQDAFNTDVYPDEWHTVSTEWTPGKVEFFIDGQSVGMSTTKVPAKPMHWVIQTESCLNVCPAQNATTDVQIDWATAYSYNQ